MNRQQRRKIEKQLAKVDPKLIEEIQKQAFVKGAKVGMELMEDGLKKEFGFGKKRLARLAQTIEKQILESEEDETTNS